MKLEILVLIIFFFAVGDAKVYVRFECVVLVFFYAIIFIQMYTVQVHSRTSTHFHFRIISNATFLITPQMISSVPRQELIRGGRIFHLVNLEFTLNLQFCCTNKTKQTIDNKFSYSQSNAMRDKMLMAVTDKF
jgi:hypothetical protein